MEVVTEPLEARLGVQVERPGDGRLLIRAGWGLEPFEVFQVVKDHLAAREVIPVARALGLPVPSADGP